MKAMFFYMKSRISNMWKKSVCGHDVCGNVLVPTLYSFFKSQYNMTHSKMQEGRSVSKTLNREIVQSATSS